MGHQGRRTAQGTDRAEHTGVSEHTFVYGNHLPSQLGVGRGRHLSVHSGSLGGGWWVGKTCTLQVGRKSSWMQLILVIGHGLATFLPSKNNTTSLHVAKGITKGDAVCYLGVPSPIQGQPGKLHLLGKTKPFLPMDKSMLGHSPGQ